MPHPLKSRIAPEWAVAIVYVGGLFTFIGGQTRNYIAAIDRATGTATAFNPAPSSSVGELELAGNKLYVGGDFLTIGGQDRVRIAALDVAGGSVLPWYPGPVGGHVTDFELDGGRLYMSGVNGVNGTVRKYLAAVDTATAALSGFAPDITIGTDVEALSVEGGVVYAAGSFQQVGSNPGERRLNLAAFDAATGALLPWNPVASSNMQSILASGTQVFVGGAMTSLNGREHRELVAFDAITGQRLPFEPTYSSGIPTTLARYGSQLVVGGQFNIGVGLPFPHALTTYDATTLTWTGWSPDLNGVVTDAVVDGDVLYVCGGFTVVDGQSRQGVAAFDMTSGTLLPWNPGNCLLTRLIAVTATDVVLAGDFSQIAGVPRLRLGSVSRATGAVTSWNPGVGGTILDIEAADGRIVACGDFTNTALGARTRLAQWDAATGALTSWNAAANGRVRGLAVKGNRVFAAGAFNLVNNSATRIGFAVFDATTGAVSPWNPGFDGNGVGVYASDDWLYCAHEIGGFDALGRGFFTPIADPALVDATPASPTAGAMRLASVGPNPARHASAVALTLPADAAVEIDVLDVTGRRAGPAVRRAFPAGVHRVPLDVAGLPPGLYLVRARAGAWTATTRLAVVR